MTDIAKEVRLLETDGSLTVYLDGDIDHHSAQNIRARIDTRLFLSRPRELVLDLSRVHFMDSAGLGLILGRLTKASELGVGFRLSNPNRSIQKILDLAGMERLVAITYTDVPRRTCTITSRGGNAG